MFGNLDYGFCCFMVFGKVFQDEIGVVCLVCFGKVVVGLMYFSVGVCVVIFVVVMVEGFCLLMMVVIRLCMILFVFLVMIECQVLGLLKLCVLSGVLKNYFVIVLFFLFSDYVFC